MLACEEVHHGTRGVVFKTDKCCRILTLFFSVSRRSLTKLLSSRSLACFFLFSCIMEVSLLSLA